MQPNTLEVADINAIIKTNNACNEVESLEPIAAVVAKFDKARVRSLDRYGYNGSFVLFVIENIMFKILME